VPDGRGVPLPPSPRRGGLRRSPAQRRPMPDRGFQGHQAFGGAAWRGEAPPIRQGRADSDCVIHATGDHALGSRRQGRHADDTIAPAGSGPLRLHRGSRAVPRAGAPLLRARDRALPPRMERAGIVPREVWRKAGAEGCSARCWPRSMAGRRGFGYSAGSSRRSGAPTPRHRLPAAFGHRGALCRGPRAAEKKREWLPRMAKGEMITAIAMTEPAWALTSRRCAPRAARRVGLGDRRLQDLNQQRQNCGLVIVVCQGPIRGRGARHQPDLRRGRLQGVTKGRNLVRSGCMRRTPRCCFSRGAGAAVNLLARRMPASPT